jgi:hypothetical protein
MIRKVLMLAFGQPGQVREVRIPDGIVDTNSILENIWHYGQNDFQNVPGCPSVSVGDVAVLPVRNAFVPSGVSKTYHICKAVGWQQITAEQLEEYKKLDRRERILSNYLT